MLVSGQGLTLPQALDREWLLTNGLGGYAMGTVSGANTRGYHGWLIAAEQPPTGRRLRLVKVEPELTNPDGQVHLLSTNLYPDAVYPDGHRFLLSFDDRLQPTWRYRLPGGMLEVTLRLVQGVNAAVAGFRLQADGGLRSLWLRPLVNDRDHHARLDPSTIRPALRAGPHGWWSVGSGSGLPLWLRVAGGQFEPDPSAVWIRRMWYPEEERRGYPSLEDHWSPGRFRVDLSPGETAWFEAWVGDDPPAAELAPATEAGSADVGGWGDRFGRAVTQSQLLNDLCHAASAFKVRSHREEPAIVAGYPWFGEWARDSVISVVGLYIVEGDFEGAAGVLRRLQSNLQAPALPSAVDEDGRPLGVAADAPLWWVLAVYRLWAYGGEVDEFLPAIEGILHSFAQGTGPLGAVRATGRGLVRADLPGIALTWMDAQVPTPVTPRAGFPVELTALFYKAVCVADRLGLSQAPYRRWAHNLSRAFRRKFRRPDGFLWDVLPSEVDQAPDYSIRPNQLFAASPPFPLLNREEVADLLLAMEPVLLTSRGLRTLSPDDARYCGRYGGTPQARDKAYHEGSAWPWLLGTWADAERFAYPRGSGPMAIRDQLDALRPALEERVLGQLAELYDGDPPHRPGGAPAQAWSVAEVIRAYCEDALGLYPQVLTDPSAAPGTFEAAVR